MNPIHFGKIDDSFDYFKETIENINGVLENEMEKNDFSKAFEIEHKNFNSNYIKIQSEQTLFSQIFQKDLSPAFAQLNKMEFPQIKNFWKQEIINNCLALIQQLTQKEEDQKMDYRVICFMEKKIDNHGENKVNPNQEKQQSPKEEDKNLINKVSKYQEMNENKNHIEKIFNPKVKLDSEINVNKKNTDKLIYSMEILKKKVENEFSIKKNERNKLSRVDNRF